MLDPRIPRISIPTWVEIGKMHCIDQPCKKRNMTETKTWSMQFCPSLEWKFTLFILTKRHCEPTRCSTYIIFNIYIYNHIYFLCTSNIYILYTCINQRGYKRCKHMLAKNTLAESRLETGCQPSTFSTQSTSTLPNLLPSVSIHFPAQQKNSC